MFKKLLKQILVISSLVLVAGTANATLIKQDILFDDLFDSVDQFVVVGQVVVNVDNAMDTGLVEDFDSFNLFGVEMFNKEEADLVGAYHQFFGLFDPIDLFAGFSTIQFDLTDKSYGLAFSGAADIDPNFNFLVDVFIPSPQGDLLLAGNIALGDVSVVPVPATALLFLSGLLVLVRRKV